MLSPKGIGPLMRSRVIGMSSERVQAHFSWDDAEPDYRVNIEYLGRLKIAVSGTVTGRLYRFTPLHPRRSYPCLHLRWPARRARPRRLRSP